MDPLVQGKKYLQGSEIAADFILVFSEILCLCTQQLFIEHLPCMPGTVSGLRKQLQINIVPNVNNMIWIFSECLLCARHVRPTKPHSTLRTTLESIIISLVTISYYCLIDSDY